MSVKSHILGTAPAFVHVVNRGVLRSPIFFSDRNYEYFLRKTEHALRHNDISLLCYCLMPNHFHLLLHQRSPGAISSFMSDVSNGYVKGINRELDRTGHLFEGKYKMKHITTDEYLLHLSRYIHLNPVRAGLVVQPQDWKFSSYREYVNEVLGSFVETSTILGVFPQRNLYQDFVAMYKAGDRGKIEGLLF